MSNKLKALIDLIDDPNDEVFNHVREEIMQFGQSAIPALEIAWENKDYGSTFLERVEDIIQDIQSITLKEELTDWIEQGGNNLLDGAIIVCRWKYPDFDENLVYNFISKLKQEIWLELHDELTSFEKVNILNNVFFNRHHFKPNKEDFLNPKNNFISDVIETKKGNPISLSIIYLILSQTLSLPIYGVNTPGHFLVSYKLSAFDLNDLTATFRNFEVEDDAKIVPNFFYINCFQSGTVLLKKHIIEFLDHQKLAHKDEYFNPCSNIDIIRRLFLNLKTSYLKLNDEIKVRNIEKILPLFNV